MQAQEAIKALRSGRKLRMAVGADPEDPVLHLWVEDGMVMSRGMAGWSAGCLEPVCEIDSGFLVGYLDNDRESVEILEGPDVR